MGATVSLEQKRHFEIERQIRNDDGERRNVIKLLLLGAGESGKTTLLKQMRIIHHGGFPDAEIIEQSFAVRENLAESMLAIMNAMIALKIDYEKTTSSKGDVGIIQKQACLLCTATSPLKPFPELAAAIQRVWADAGVRGCRRRSNEYQLNDSVDYLIDNVARICASGYTATEQDILRVRVQTLGVVQLQFKLNGFKFSVFDVGGQRSQRRKWLHCFDDVTAVLFLVAMSEYDQVLREDGVTNRMVESLRLFDAICNCPHFALASMILFLNKIDIFVQKISQRPVTNVFPNYSGVPDSFEESSNFILKSFLALHTKYAKKPIYHHFTCATDTKQISKILAATTDTIATKYLSNSGIVES